jgi:hypothetical protein
MAKRKPSRQVTEPTYTLEWGEPVERWEGKRERAEYYVLGPNDTLHLPYGRRDGSFFVGPGIVQVCHYISQVNVLEMDVNAPNYWATTVDLIKRGHAALLAEVALSPR